MRYPKFLEKNGTIGFVAPSFGCNTEPYKSAFVNAQKKFTQMGYHLDLGPNCYEGSGVGISSTPEKCGQELTEYYCSHKNDVLISCGGGELMCETLNYTDYEKIKAAPAKWYMGYSDNTNFTFLLNTLCDTASIYGPCAATFGMEPWHSSIEDAFALLTGQKKVFKGYDTWEKESLKDETNPLAAYNTTEPKILKHYPDGDIQMEGRLIGGCMDCLVNLLGTQFDNVPVFLEQYKEDGFIWFLESCELNVMSMRRAMWQMKNAGWFNYVKGFLIGRPLFFGQEMFGLDQYEAMLFHIHEFNVPVIMDADLGHLSPCLPIVSGAKAKITAKGNDLTVSYEL
ncbi:S66 family peptidase [[Clostridium] polysaccharolyticum]|uniref:Muramoyltetrapeptide carboxypeptidase LdcA (Peptidoglycan recycling) n=1 Tax=[Clostridium] polysaccharolyticum TaxID=29364 RepID=A0A1I0BI01_9FIRM|nr:S66 peptidase family protein [[Clostridium] polysaccharolyticum]SET05866.1 Muramoyltetrapeptide carboxypeptidase LdcA (peptidoglycan recycling) [[Clostridium] polysaccharolyticum]